MNPRTTGILLGVALALFAFVWFYELEGESGRLEAEEATKRLFAGIEPEEIAWIELRTNDDVAARLEQGEGVWRVVSPVEHRADAAVERIAETLATITHEAVLGSPGPDAEYGLDEATARVVRFGTAEAEYALRLGNDTPVGSNVYARTGGGDAIYTVARYRKSGFEKSLAELREKRILDFDPSAIRAIEASWPDGRVRLARVATPDDQGGDGEGVDAPDPRTEAAWRMLEPVEASGDANAVERLLSTLAYLRATAFIDAPDEAAAGLLEPPDFSVSLALEDAEASPLRLAIGRVGAGDRRPVRVGEGGPRFWIGAERVDDFARESSAYRDRTVVAVDPSQVRELDFFFRSGAGETLAVRAARGGSGAWSSEPETFAEGKLSRIVAELGRLEAETILAESMGAEELRGVGLSPPNTILTVLGETPEGAGEGLPPEASTLAELHLGAIDADGIVARRAGEDPIYRLGLDVAERLPVSLEAFENRFRAEPQPAAEEAPLPAEGAAGAEWVDPGEESP